MRSRSFYAIFIGCLLIANHSFAEAIEGEWLRSDGTARLKISITPKGKLEGHLSWLKNTKRSLDTKNPDKQLRNRKLIGLKLIKNFWKEGTKWVGGTVYDSKTGKVYKGKIWLENANTLKMRGFIGISLIGQTAEWKRHST